MKRMEKNRISSLSSFIISGDIPDCRVMFDRLLSRRGLSFDRLRSLVDFAETGSITRAARGDPNRQSQYSRQIKELEQFFGIELTQRRGKGIALTEAGKRLVLIARETFLSLNDFEGTNRNQPL